MLYVGIDPGADGGIGVIDTLEDSAEAYVYSDATLINIIHRPGRMKVTVEHVHAMPGQGSKSTFNFGVSFGKILGILDSLRQPYELVMPQKWKREFSCTADKKSSIEVCKRLFPLVDLKRTEKCKKEHDGMAEALLLAEFGRRHMK